MAEENAAHDQEGHTQHPDENRPENGTIAPSHSGATQQTEAEKQNDNPDHPRKRPLVIRLWHALYRKRMFFHHEANWAEITSVIITFGILVATSMQAYIYWKQSLLMENGLSQNQQAIALNMGQVAIAGRNATAAEKGLKATQEAMRMDQRAWVSADIGERDQKFFIAMHNSGKTPALNGTYIVAFSPSKPGAVPEPDFTNNSSTPIILPKNLPPEIAERLKREGVIPEHPPSGYVISPGKSEISSYFGADFSKTFRFPPDQRMYIQGRFTYDDIFGKSHETRFCYWYAPPDGFPMCNTHNHAD